MESKAKENYFDELPFSNENDLIRYMHDNPYCVLFASRSQKMEYAGLTNKYISILPEILMALNAVITICFAIVSSDLMCLIGLLTSVVGVILFFVPRKPIIGYILLCFTAIMAIKTGGTAVWVTLFVTMLLGAIGIKCWFLVLGNMAGRWMADNVSEFWDLWERVGVAISYEGKVYMHDKLGLEESKLKRIDQSYREEFGTYSHPYTKKKIASAQEYLEGFISQKRKENIQFDHRLTLEELDERYADEFGDINNPKTGEPISSTEG